MITREEYLARLQRQGAQGYIKDSKETILEKEDITYLSGPEQINLLAEQLTDAKIKYTSSFDAIEAMANCITGKKID